MSSPHNSFGAIQDNDAMLRNESTQDRKRKKKKRENKKSPAWERSVRDGGGRCQRPPLYSLTLSVGSLRQKLGLVKGQMVATRLDRQHTAREAICETGGGRWRGGISPCVERTRPLQKRSGCKRITSRWLITGVAVPLAPREASVRPVSLGCGLVAACPSQEHPKQYQQP